MAGPSSAPTDATTWDGPEAPEHLRARYPRMTEYLSQVPGGIRAYPQCQARSAILQTFLDVGPKLEEPLDPFVARLLKLPPRGFIPEVVQGAAFLAVADAARMDEAQFMAWNRDGNRGLFTGLLFRALMALFSPMVLLERAPARWGAFHPGSRLEVTPDGAGGARGVLTFPERLLTRLLLVGIAECFAVGFEQARGRDVTVKLDEHGPTSATFLARWR